MEIEEIEIWKDIIGYEGLYQISNLGRVQSLDRFIKRKRFSITLREGKELKQTITAAGYLSITLSNNKIKTTFLVHRLVAIAFIPNPENKPDINHKKGIKTDNRVSEIEWCTKSENLTHAYKIGLREVVNGIKCHYSKLTEKQVLEIRELYANSNLNYNSIALIYYVKEQTISSIINKKTWAHI